VIAVVPVRRGELPAAAGEAVAEAGGRALVAGEGARQAARSLGHVAAAVRYCELGVFQPGRWAPGLAPHVADEDVVLLPASPDGRDLAPRLAAALRRPLFAGALAVSPQRVDLVRLDGRLTEQHEPEGAFVATLLPGSRAVADAGSADAPVELEPEEVWIDLGDEPDARLVEIVDADAAAVDLAEAERVIAGGAGLTGDGAFERLTELGRRLHASVGATRVVTDAGLVPHDRQIGTTGVSINPRCYLAFGISGAAQHLCGIGDPEHIVAVNLDASCPMMAMADLALVTEAGVLVEALLALLEGGRA